MQIPTNITRKGNKLLIRSYDETTGKRKNILTPFKPHLYERAPAGTPLEVADALSLRGEKHPLNDRIPLTRMEFDNIWDFTQHVYDKRDIPGYEMFGLSDVVGQAYSRLFPQKIEHNLKHVSTFNVDIEVMSSYIGQDGNVVRGPFPEPIIETEEYRKKSFDMKKYTDHITEYYKWWASEFPKSKIPVMLDCDAAFPVTMIQLSDWLTGDLMVWSLPLPKDAGKYQYNNDDPMIGGLQGRLKYFEFDNEQDLLKAFVKYWAANSPDAMTGWHIKSFDVGYIVGRVNKILGEDWVAALSPVGVVKKYLVRPEKGIPFHSYRIHGVAILDYILLYRKHRLVERKSYTLDYICSVETGERKIEYSGDLNTVYLTDYETYVRYGIKDPLLVDGLDAKLSFINLSWALQATYKCDVEDTLETVKPWRYLMFDHNYNKGDKPLVPLIKKRMEAVHFEGAFVHNPIVGMHKLIVAEDLKSLYPHIQQQWNMGPETIVNEDTRSNIIFDLIDEITDLKVTWEQESAKEAMIKAISNDSEIIEELIQWSIVGLPDGFQTLEKYNVCMSGNLQFFHKEEESCYSSIGKVIYKERSYHKGLMFKHEQAKLNAKEINDEITCKTEDYLEATQGTFQMGKKIVLNAGYGAIGNASFVEYFDPLVARAITAGGMLINKYTTEFVNTKLSEMLGRKHKFIVYGDTDSCAPSTLLNIDGEQKTIAEWYESLQGKVEVRGEENFIKHLDGSNKTHSVGKDGKLNYNKVNYIMKHKVKKKGYKIKVDGKEIIVTCDHSLIVKRNGKIISVKPNEVKKGDRFITISEKESTKELEGISTSYKQHSLEEHSEFVVECIGEIDDYVYDIEVENDHNFFGNDILIHNSVYMCLDPLREIIGLEDSMTRDEQINIVDKFEKEVISPFIKTVCERMCKLVNGREQRMFWEREVICLDGGIFQAKKKYALLADDNEGVRYPHSKLKITGLASKVSKTPDLVVPWLEESYKMAIRGEFENLQAYIKERKKEYKTLPIADIAGSSSVKEIHKWVINFDDMILKSGVPFHVRASLLHNHLVSKMDSTNLEYIDEGDKIKIINIIPNNPFSADGKFKYLAFSETWPEEFEVYRNLIDYNKLFTTIFEDQVQLFLNAVGETTKKSVSLW